jgi:hypothetical protein
VTESTAGVAAYAGAPLITSEGHCLGTISGLERRVVARWTDHRCGASAARTYVVPVGPTRPATLGPFVALRGLHPNCIVKASLQGSRACRLRMLQPGQESPG